MKASIISLLPAGLLFLAACHTVKPTALPLSADVDPADNYTIVWNGTSKAYRYENGQWLRDARYDYRFDVVQERYEKHWKSVKSLHRIHPDYDGKAGSRDQTMYFDVAYRDLKDGLVKSDIHASLGNGQGSSDAEFRRAELVMYVPSPGRFLPYNKLRIRQEYNYEAGILTETVELILEKNGRELPFMKNEERAAIFLKGRLDKAPTIFKP